MSLLSIISAVVLAASQPFSTQSTSSVAYVPASIVHVSTVPVTLIPQATCCWCWAASGEMVMKYFGIDVPQCKQAATQFNVPGCCATPYPNACISGGTVLIKDYGFSFQQNGAAQPLTFPQMIDQTDKRREPWIFNYVGTGFGHVLVGVGYEQIRLPIYGVGGAGGTRQYTENLVAVNDPWPPGKGATYLEPYSQYVSGVYLGNNYQDGYDIYDVAPPLRIHVPPIRVNPTTVRIPMPVPPDWRGPFGPDPQTAAANALVELRALVQGGGASIVGISAPEAAEATLGNPMRVYNVPVEPLRAYTRAARTEPLVVATQSYIYPVVVNGAERTTIEVSEIGGRWVGHSYGRATLARSIAQYRTSPTDKLIYVPSANELFIGKGEAEQLRLTPISTSVKLNLTAGQELTGSAALEKLVPEAREYDGKPR